MSGLFDMHTVVALKNYWRSQFGNNFEDFKALFVGVDDGVILRWFNKLRGKGTQIEGSDFVRFGTSWSPDVKPQPYISVQLQDEPLEQQPLAFDGGVINGFNAVSMYVKEIASIAIYTNHPELTRALHVFVRAVMMLSVKWFSKIGYCGLSYLGGTDLEPERELTPELLGVFLRMQRWSALSEPTFKESSITHNPILVAAADVTVNEHTGGIAGQPLASSTIVPSRGAIPSTDNKITVIPPLKY